MSGSVYQSWFIQSVGLPISQSVSQSITQSSCQTAYPFDQTFDNSCIRQLIHSFSEFSVNLIICSNLLFSQARFCLLSLGFTVGFGAMFSKTWRVHQIFTNIKKIRKVKKQHQQRQAKQQRQQQQKNKNIFLSSQTLIQLNPYKRHF